MTERRPILTILLGVLLIAVLTPVSQFLTVGLINSDLETASPVGWAVGIILSLTLAIATIRLISKRRLLNKSGIVILYCMLTIAVPMMNMGLVRALFSAIRAVQEHYVKIGVNTYRTAYQAERPSWFPVIPTTEGLAWNKADRLLRLLQDPSVLKGREQGRRDIVIKISAVAKSKEEVHPAELAKTADSIRTQLGKLGVDEVEAILKQAESQTDGTDPFRKAIQALGLMPDLKRHLSDTREASAAAASRLTTLLARYGEHEACYATTLIKQRPQMEQRRFERDLQRLSPDGRRQLDANVSALDQDFDTLRRNVSCLSRLDFTKVLNQRKAQYLESFSKLTEPEMAELRASFIYRSSALERKAMYSQNGQNGTPNQNAIGMEASVWEDPAIQRSADQAGMWAKVQMVWRNIPWSLWRAPLAHWSILILCIFLFLMCLAEWLRRKWVDRENLAFPVVELVDNVIRHDYAMETATDPTQPEPRGRLFAPTFWIGCAFGLLIISLEALGNYAMTGRETILSFDVSGRIFTSGVFREMGNVYFVVSPIAVGLLFLVSLEISFSIFLVYFLYRFAMVIGKLAAGNIIDPSYTGWAGGMNYPFEMEQLLGACVCLALICFWKMRHSAAQERHDLAIPEASPYIPARLNAAGLLVLPIAIGALIWNLGITNIPLLVGFGALSVCLAVAAARVRAETGLPTQHVTYEFTKFPIILGLTGWMGSKIYTLFVSLAFLPVTLLFRLLPQQLENIELARRHRIKYGTIAVASLVAFLTALSAGILSFLVLAYYRGSAAWGEKCTTQGQNFTAIFSYPLWVSHFLGEDGLANFREVHWIRIGFIVLGATIFGMLYLLRSRVMRFPIHPLGYLLILLSVHFTWIVPYFKSPGTVHEVETSWLWGSALIAWLLKKLVVKYGGMNTYRRAKPLFIGLAVGAIFGIFVWNMAHLGAMFQRANLGPSEQPGSFVKTFTDRPPYSPKAY